ncbi:MAG: 2-oxoacid:ferredoxin oxidoreductase subunit beta [Armatimonadia bacterium]|nr:2-oxoacid:ferredoxin oxidoreductase subunit beta [Armatimonadia bacterium]
MSETSSPTNEAPLLDTGVERDLQNVQESGLLDYRSESLPTWCPGCGYYGITHAMTEAINELDIEPHNLVFVSGIGCAGRYPFFMNAYGLHAIHGRAVPMGAGVKIANPDLSVIVVGGDGDGLGIGGGHLSHAIRRNVDITYILFDNGIYGLTKGQTSPTTPQEQITGTHPYGNPDMPLDAVTLGISYRASFVARGYAGQQHDLTPIMRRAFAHKGFSFVVVYTPCVTFDKVNITYENMRGNWKPLPDDYDDGNILEAMKYAMDDTLWHGVFYEEQRPTFHDHERETAEKARS